MIKTPGYYAKWFFRFSVFLISAAFMDVMRKEVGDESDQARR